LKLNNPRRSTFPFRWTDSNHARRSRFVEPESVSTLSGRVKRLSFSNDRALNPSISGTEVGSLCSNQRAQGFSSTCSKHYELSIGCVHEEHNDNKSEGTKLSIVDRMQRLRAANESATPRRQTTPSKIAHTSSKRDSVSSTSILPNSSVYLHVLFKTW
jgi:NIMA (never in mitosis gene a)-related kinase